jgi:His/Glu/Gln/Arg/opine family amino acid ABC transporter permease subunit
MAHDGLENTARIAVFAVLGSTVIGIVLGTLMTIRFLPLQGLIRLYVEVWRGLPILVTIFLVYYALPTAPIIHHRFGVITGAVIGLALWGSAQVAEATRGAVQSIPREQHEAAAALGFGWLGRHRSVILPQALRRLMPPLVSLLANVIQNTTIASLIGVTELLATGQRSIERLQFEAGAESHAFAIYAAVMAAFFCISFPLTRLAIYLERRLI